MLRRQFLLLNIVLVIASAMTIGCSAGRRVGVENNAHPSTGAFKHRTGDLLFQDLDCGPTCDAIEAVTHGVDGYHLSHIGLIVDRLTAAEYSATHNVLTRSDADWFVLEALSVGVILTPLPDFLARSQDTSGNPKVIVGRLVPAHQPLVPGAVERGLSYLGTRYDDYFEMGDDALYCSEMIHYIFAPMPGGRPIFELAPMTFRSPETGEFFPAWVQYYQRLGRPIPEGEPGINPAAISRAPVLRVVHAYGQPDRSEYLGDGGFEPLVGPPHLFIDNGFTVRREDHRLASH